MYYPYTIYILIVLVEKEERNKFSSRCLWQITHIFGHFDSPAIYYILALTTLDINKPKMVNAPVGLNQVILRKVRRFRSFVCHQKKDLFFGKKRCQKRLVVAKNAAKNNRFLPKKIVFSMIDRDFELCLPPKKKSFFCQKTLPKKIVCCKKTLSKTIVCQKRSF